MQLNWQKLLRNIICESLKSKSNCHKKLNTCKEFNMLHNYAEPCWLNWMTSQWELAAAQNLRLNTPWWLQCPQRNGALSVCLFAIDLVSDRFVFLAFSFRVYDLGTPVCTIIDELLEKFQTAFDPLPFFGKNVAIFSKIHDDQHWIYNEIFWIGNDPPPISKFSGKSWPKV